MPRFPIVPQRTRAPAAFSNSPRAEAADFGGGLGEAVAEFGAEAAGLAQVIKKRQELAERQAAREAKRASDEAEAETLAEDAEQPDAAGSVERRQQSFEKKAEVLRQNYKDHPLEPQVNEQLELQGQAWTRKQVSGEAGRRAKADLARADEISGRWLARVTQDPAQFDEAAANLLGDDGPVKGLGLRPEVQAAWEAQTLEALLSAQMQSDPGRLISDLEAGRWAERLSKEQQENWLEDARDAVSLRDRKQSLERRQRIAGEVLALQRSIASGEAGLMQVRRAEREGRLSPEQIVSLKQDVEQAEVRAQILQAAQDEYEIALISGIGFNAESEAHRQVAEDFYVATFREMVRAGADETTQDRLADAVARTGYVTKGLAQDLTAALSSEDPDRRVAAAQLYGRLLEAAPDLLPPSLEPEVRALGGVLHRWLDAGLPPEESLKRAEAELPSDGAVSFLSDEELGVLQRDLRAGLGGRSGQAVGQLLARLDEKYLSLLGQSYSVKDADREIQKDIGLALIRLEHMEARLADAGFVWRIEDGQPVLTATEPRLQKAAAPAVVVAGAGAAAGAVIAAAAALSWSIQVAKDFGFEVSDEIEQLNSLLNGLSDDTRIYVFETLPELAGWFDKAVIRLGDGIASLGQVISENEHVGLREVVIFRKDYGRMVVRQQWDLSAERYYDVDVTFWDPQAKREVTERFPNSRFFVPANDVGALTSPPLRPHPERGGQLEGLKPHDRSGESFTTAGDPPDNSVVEERPGGFVPIGPNGPVKTISPDQSQELSRPTILLSEGDENSNPQKKGRSQTGGNDVASGSDASSADPPSNTAETGETSAATQAQSSRENEASPASAASSSDNQVDTSGNTSSAVSDTENDSASSDSEQAGSDGSGIKLTRGGKRQIGNLTALKDHSVLEAAKTRGARAQEIQSIQTDYQDKSVAEIANLAAKRDQAAVRALKVIKDAARLAQKRHGQ